jgi:hypothetical protein
MLLAGFCPLTGPLLTCHRYIEAIERILKPGGVWINLGPLLYHWASSADAADEDRGDARYDQSVEVSAALVPPQ